MTESELQNAVESHLRYKGLPVNIAVTFSDVGIVDRTSRVERRGDIKNLGVQLTNNVRLKVPIVSANMKDVTESRMGIALAREGGCGFIHQFGDIDWRADEIRRVKRADNQVVDRPFVVKEDEVLEAAVAQMKKHGAGLLVVNQEKQLVGMLTTRDVRFLHHLGKNFKNLLVRDVMKISPLHVGRPDVKIEEAIAILQQHRIEKLPLVDEGNHVVGLITAKDILKRDQYPNAARDKNGRLIVGAAVGFNNTVDEVKALLDAGADLILLDTARANSFSTVEKIKAIKAAFPEAELVVGNVDNAEGAYRLVEAGANVIKVGIGPGSACKTRVETGVGVPQVTAIAEAAAIACRSMVSVIADGGIRKGRELAIAIVAGASCAMLGGAFAGTDESPGDIFIDGGRRFKVYRGSASLALQLDRVSGGNLDKVRAPEGEHRRVECKGEVRLVVEDLMADLRSAMSYANATSVNELRLYAKFFRQTHAGYLEGEPQK